MGIFHLALHGSIVIRDEEMKQIETTRMENFK